jgi:hypothetical protein
LRSLQDTLIAASFWVLESDGIDGRSDGDEQRTIAAIIGSRGLDGSDWLFEGRRKNIYRAASRWSPRGLCTISAECSSSWSACPWRR